MTIATFTAEEFVERKSDLPEGGRWVELVRGEIVTHDPPSEAHGNVVLNLSKRMAAYLQSRPPEQPGYAGFETGIVVGRNPDTIRYPAVSYFTSGSRFAAVDAPLTELVPEIVMEIASTNSRRGQISTRVDEYHAFGTPYVWIVDPHEEAIHVCPRAAAATTFSAGEIVSGEPVLPGFSLTPSDLFAPPEWWNRPLGS